MIPLVCGLCFAGCVTRRFAHKDVYRCSSWPSMPMQFKAPECELKVEKEPSAHKSRAQSEELLG